MTGHERSKRLRIVVGVALLFGCGSSPVEVPATGKSAAPTVPSKAAERSSIVQISAGSAHSCVLFSDYTIKCWGFGRYAQLGQRHLDNLGDDESVASIEPVATLAAKEIHAGGGHTCALSRRGAIYCWGLNDSGQTGELAGAAELTPIGNEPVPLAGLVRTLATGMNDTCAVQERGQLRCWGVVADKPSDHFGVLATGIRQVVVGDEHLCALDETGAVVCWGGYAFEVPGRKIVLPGPARALATARHSTCALLEDGRVSCWGRNDLGQLGRGSQTPGSLEPKITKLPRKANRLIGSGTGDHFCAVSEGALFCWGANRDGQLGTAATRPRTWAGPHREVKLSDRVPLPGAVDLVSAGGGHTCATVKSELYCWGNNASGQLGRGADVPGSSPAASPGLPARVSL